MLPICVHVKGHKFSYDFNQIWSFTTDFRGSTQYEGVGKVVKHN